MKTIDAILEWSLFAMGIVMALMGALIILGALGGVVTLTILP